MSLAALAKSLEGAIGANSDEQEVTIFLDTGYEPLNKIMTGSYNKGLPAGRIIEIFGPSSSGKTILATRAMVEGQKKGGIAIFQDFERSLDVSMAEHIGLNTEYPLWIYKRPRTWEEANMQIAKAAQAIRASKAIPDEAPIVAVLDSVAAAVPKSSIDKDMDELSMNDTTALARVTSTTLKTMKQHVADYGITMIYLNQTRTKPGVTYGDPTTTPGGVAMEFFADVRLSLSKVKLKDNDPKEWNGYTMKITCRKTKFVKPFQVTEVDLRFDAQGMPYFDVIGGLVKHLIDIDVLKQSGPRVTWLDGKTYFPSQLIEKVEKENLHGELQKLLPV